MSVTPARPGTAAAILAAFLLAASPAFADFTGRVVSISDGDTITVLDSDNHQHKVRIAGIDAPERHQPFGEKSRASMGALAFHQEARLDCRKQDRYRRDVCTVFIEAKDIGLEQVTRGMAWWYRAYAKEQTQQQRQDYEVAEFQAQSRRAGLWAEKNPVPPWEWRRAK